VEQHTRSMKSEDSLRIYGATMGGSFREGYGVFEQQWGCSLVYVSIGSIDEGSSWQCIL